MDIVGKWQVAKVAMLGEDFEMKMVSAEEILAMPDNDETAQYKEMVSAINEFTADNRVLTYVPIPEYQIEEARAEGLVITEDGYGIVDETDWKEENGKILYNTREEGEIMGEKVDPYVVLEIDAEGYIPFAGGMMMLKKI
ncbi:MAG: hypothetical protein IKU19_04455 [Clostridia bacterium]|nr:hypothetical protein [Clostridia bacterium]